MAIYLCLLASLFYALSPEGLMGEMPLSNKERKAKLLNEANFIFKPSENFASLDSHGNPIVISYAFHQSRISQSCSVYANSEPRNPVPFSKHGDLIKSLKEIIDLEDTFEKETYDCLNKLSKFLPISKLASNFEEHVANPFRILIFRLIIEWMNYQYKNDFVKEKHNFINTETSNDQIILFRDILDAGKDDPAKDDPAKDDSYEKDAAKKVRYEKQKNYLIPLSRAIIDQEKRNFRTNTENFRNLLKEKNKKLRLARFYKKYNFFYTELMNHLEKYTKDILEKLKELKDEKVCNDQIEIDDDKSRMQVTLLDEQEKIEQDII